MSNKPIFVATHPRACSTAFERVFMTRRDVLQCIHEPFGDAYYYGPERLSSRFEGPENAKARQESGYDQSTYKTILDRFEREASEGKRLFVKDMAQYLVPPHEAAARIAPSLAGGHTTGVGTGGAEGPPFPYGTAAEEGNPSVIPAATLARFHFTFLIRHPRSSVPSYYRCTVPPLDEITGFKDYMPVEAGYVELRQLFDFLRGSGQVGGSSSGVSVCVIDADDLLDNPSGIIQQFCQAVGIEYDPAMLKWDTPDDHAHARAAFEKWRGFHEDAIDSTELRARTHKKVHPPDDQQDAEWAKKFGPEGAKTMRETVNANVKEYEYLKSFAITPDTK